MGRATGLALGLISLARAALAQFGAAPAPAAYLRLVLRRYVVPAEATVRRAILILAARLPLPVLRAGRVSGKAPPPRKPPHASPGARPPVFCLTEAAPRARAPRPAPEAPLPSIRFLDVPSPPAPAPGRRPSADEDAMTARLLRRLSALERAYLDPEREARRYLRRRLRDGARGRALRGLSFARIPGNSRHLYAPFRDILHAINTAAQAAGLPISDSS